RADGFRGQARSHLRVRGDQPHRRPAGDGSVRSGRSLRPRAALMAVADIGIVRRMAGTRRAVGAWTRRSRFWDLPLFWKLLLPSVALITVLGAVGGFVIVRDLAERAHAVLDQQLSRASLDARAVLSDRQLYLLESANFASNLKGAPTAIGSGDARASGRLLLSMLALKPDVDDVAAVGRDGSAIIEFIRSTPASRPRQVSPAAWKSQPFLHRALGDETGTKFVG